MSIIDTRYAELQTLAREYSAARGPEQIIAVLQRRHALARQYDAELAPLRALCASWTYAPPTGAVSA